MITCRTDLPYTDTNKTIRLVFTSCQHFGSRGFHRNRFRQFLSEEMNHPQTYLILMGDIFDAIIPSDGKRFDPAEIDPKYLQDNPSMMLNHAINDCISEIMPYKDQLLGIVTGNHEYQYLRRYGINLTQLMCDKFECRNLGMSFLMKVLLKNKHKAGKVRSFVIYGHHGFGGGSRTEGGGLTKYERTIKQYDADVYCFGHDHDTWSKKIPRLGINVNGGIVDKSLTMLCCGTFKKSLSDNEIPTWEESKGFGPKNLGGRVITVTVKSNSWLDIED